MKLPVVTRPIAAAEFDSAYRWYEQQRSGLGEEFLEATYDLVRRIADHPKQFQIVHRDIRRAVLTRFPYSIFYRLKADHVVLVACFHSKRNPTKWMSRR